MLFSKMHGLGNDFILINGLEGSEQDYNALAAIVCDRHLGIGADGLEVVLPSDAADLRMRIINSDGSEAEMCGNGIRCFAKYVYEKGIIDKTTFTVETLAGIMEPELIVEDGIVKLVKVNMGKPGLERSDIPMIGAKGMVLDEAIDVDGDEYKISAMLVGVPHTMVFVDDAESAPLYEIGPKIENHKLFPQRTNVNFVEVINDGEIKVRTWERGAGVTLACGTGCCASVVAAALTGRTARKATVHLMEGDLIIDWTEDGTIFMTGPAINVFEGEYDPK